MILLDVVADDGTLFGCVAVADDRDDELSESFFWRQGGQNAVSPCFH